MIQMQPGKGLTQATGSERSEFKFKLCRLGDSLAVQSLAGQLAFLEPQSPIWEMEIPWYCQEDARQSTASVQQLDTP